MITVTTDTSTPAPAGLSRGQTVWLFAAQAVVLGLLVLALCWSPVPKHGPRLLLLLLTAGLLVASLWPRWHAGAITGILGGTALATACWLSADHTWEWQALTGYVPSIMPYMAGAALVLLIWGAVARIGVFRQARFGAGALVGGLLLVVCSLLFFSIINYMPAFHALYAVERYQLEELLAAALLYPTAIWLGEVSIRAARRWSLLPIGGVLVLIAFLVYWGRK